MRLTRLDWLVLVFGGAAVLGGAGFSVSSEMPRALALVGQLMLFAVLLAAVVLGRRGGTYAALGASVLYVAFLLPSIPEDGLTREVLIAVATRLLSFGIVGILAAEMLTRMRYSLARTEGPAWIDEWSHLYSQRYMHAELDRAAAKYERYGEVCSIVVLTLATAVVSNINPLRQRALVRDLGNRIRADVRSVDQVARLDDGRFVALLPHTGREGGLVVRDRLLAQARSVLAPSPDPVTAVCLSLPEDSREVLRLIDAIGPAEEEP